HCRDYICTSCSLNPYLSPLSFFYNHPATTEIYTLSLHDALPILKRVTPEDTLCGAGAIGLRVERTRGAGGRDRLYVVGEAHGLRSEEHTSELQSPYDLVCRLLLEKKNTKNITIPPTTQPQHHQHK